MISNKRLFIDIGAHFGQSAEVAIDPRYNFDEIHSYEPSKLCFKELRRIKDSRVRIYNFGLSDTDGQSNLYGSGELGGSIFVNKKQLLPKSQLIVERIDLVQASKQLRPIFKKNHLIFMKLNCEGSEVAILQDLITHDLIDKNVFLYIDFDIKKVQGMEYLSGYISQKLKKKQINFYTSEDFGVSGPRAVRMWLDQVVPIIETSKFDFIKYQMGFHIDLKLRTYRIIKKIIPLSLRKRLYPFLSKSQIVRFFRA